MNSNILLAIIFSIVTAIAIVFQIALFLGAPLGEASMGGKFKGSYPSNMRFVALINSFFLFIFIIIVFIRSNLFFYNLFYFSKIAIWFIVIFTLINTILNLISPSKIEKFWAIVTIIQFITTLLIAIK